MFVKLVATRFHSFRDFGPAWKGVAGFRSHKRGMARRALMGVKLNLLPAAGSERSLKMSKRKSASY